MKFTVENLIEKYGYSRADAELEVKRATCEHDYGTMCYSEPFTPGCYRKCIKCGQMMGLGRHCS